MFSNYDDEDLDPSEKRRRLENMPLYQKANEIVKLTSLIIETIPDDDERFDAYVQFMREDSQALPAKISGAIAVDLYDLKMENAVIIRKSARDLLTHTSGLKMLGYKDTQYTQLLRDAIDEFRLLFVDWVEEFDPWNYHIDRWGLFNPPGISAHDKDPDDDIPFNDDDI